MCMGPEGYWDSQGPDFSNCTSPWVNIISQKVTKVLEKKDAQIHRVYNLVQGLLLCVCLFFLISNYHTFLFRIKLWEKA